MFFFLLGFFFNFACPYISSHETEERRGKGIVVGLGETDFLLVLWNGVVVLDVEKCPPYDRLLLGLS